MRAKQYILPVINTTLSFALFAVGLLRKPCDNANTAENSFNTALAAAALANAAKGANDIRKIWIAPPEPHLEISIPLSSIVLETPTARRERIIAERAGRQPMSHLASLRASEGADMSNLRQGLSL